MSSSYGVLGAVPMAALPKAELHVHLEGTLEADEMFRLAKKNGIALPWESEADARSAYSFTGLEHFLALYFQGCQVLRARQDFYDLTIGYLRRASVQGVLRAEMFFGPQSFLDLGVSVSDQMEAILGAIDDARVEWGIDGALLVSAHRHRSESDALDLLEAVRPWAASITGYGLGGAERDNPPRKFQRYFAACRAMGGHTTIHAGEDGPAVYIREAIELCQPERVDHGTAAAKHPPTMAMLRDSGTPVTSCPISNLKLGVIEELHQLPIRTFANSAVTVTVNSDDPSYFGAYVNENYDILRDELDFSFRELANLARNSFTTSFADAPDITRWLALIDALESPAPPQ